MTVFSALVLATEAGAEEGLQLIPEFAELLWGLVAFSLLMLFVSKFVFPRIGTMLDARAAAIQGQIDEAEQQRQEAERLRREYEQQLADARNQAATIVEEARGDAEQIRVRARDDAEAARLRVVADLRGQVAAASVALAGKIVQRELDPQQHRALVDQYINELSGLN